jgi:hypothetical protein
MYSLFIFKGRSNHYLGTNVGHSSQLCKRDYYISLVNTRRASQLIVIKLIYSKLQKVIAKSHV